MISNKNYYSPHNNIINVELVIVDIWIFMKPSEDGEIFPFPIFRDIRILSASIGRASNKFQNLSIHTEKLPFADGTIQFNEIDTPGTV